MPKTLLSVPNKLQLNDCWAACAAMIMDYLGQPIEYAVNDPNFKRAAIAVSKGNFELAWLEREYAYALLAL